MKLNIKRRRLVNPCGFQSSLRLLNNLCELRLIKAPLVNPLNTETTNLVPDEQENICVGSQTTPSHVEFVVKCQIVNRVAVILQLANLFIIIWSNRPSDSVVKIN